MTIHDLAHTLHQRGFAVETDTRGLRVYLTARQLGADEIRLALGERPDVHIRRDPRGGCRVTLA